MMNLSTPPLTLDQALMLEAVEILTRTDADLAQVVADFGPPPLWAREPSFATLFHIILEQQVSLASANATFARLLDIATPLTPASFLAIDDEVLRTIGISRQKQRYGRHLAQSLLSGQLNLTLFPSLPDEDVRAQLIQIKGVGAWTANIYLMEVLLRPDIWPVNDLALASATQQVKGLATRPSPGALRVIAEPWRPWRAVAARILWHSYLSQR